MRFNDAVIGSVLAAIAIAVLIHVETFPSLPLHEVGPATFPRALAWGLLGCGVILVFSGFRTRATIPMLSLGSWARSPRSWRRLIMVPGAVLAYTFAAVPVGFIPTTALLLFILVMDFSHGRWIAALSISATFTCVVYLVFVHILLVPLPPGVLVGIIR
jgi:putative tricarboxylic transport membrane protein